MFYSKIIGTGSFLPKNVVANRDLTQMMDTSDEWIVQRTGICQRHIADETETVAVMGAKAAEKALKSAGISAAEVEMIVLATTTPDDVLPATAVKIQNLLGAGGFAFDVQAVCSGFVYAISVADSFIKSGSVKNALVIGAEKMSSIVDWQDRNTAVLFGDGAGAVVLSASETAGILKTKLYSDGDFYNSIYCGPKGYLQMQGKEVFFHAVQKITDSTKQLLTESQTDVNAIDMVVPHQANIRIITQVAQKLQIPFEKFVMTLDKQGNTSAASIPLALDSVHDSLQNKLVLISGMGAGFTWGGLLVQF